MYVKRRIEPVNGKIKLRVQGLTSSPTQSNAYALILAEEEGSHRIPIIIGAAEAQSIAIALEHITPPRPLAHDLLVAFSKITGIRLREVFIYKYKEGVFYSELVFDNGDNSFSIDSRTSDAIAIALRANCGIYTSQGIVEESSVVLNDGTSQEKEEPKESDEDIRNLEPDDIHDEARLKRWLSLLDKKELIARMEEAISEENYEHARMYRDELRHREEERK